MQPLVKNAVIFGGAAALAVAGAITLQHGLGPVPLAMVAAAIVAGAFAGFYKSAAPLLAAAEESVAAHNRTSVTLQNRLAAVEQHMQHQIAAHLKTAEADKRRALESGAAKSLYLVHMSQAIRTPLTGLVGSLELMSRTALTEQQQRLTATMERSAGLLLDIVNDVLDLANTDGGMLKLAEKTFEIGDCVEAAAEVFETQARDKGLKVNVFVSSDIPQFLKGDAGRLRQVLMNLVANAVEHTQSGAIDIGAMLRGRQDNQVRIRFVVRDTGKGIPPGLQKMVFLPADRRDGVNVSTSGGAGLGLSIVQQLIQHMGGALRLESAVNRGTVIEFELPFEVAEQAADLSASQAVNFTGMCALVIGEHEAERQVIGGYLTAAGANVEAAATAWEGVELMQNAAKAGTPFTMVVAEGEVCFEADGDFAAALRNEFPVSQAGLVMVINNDGKLDDLQAQAMGNWEYVTKPLRRKELIEAVERQLLYVENGFREEEAAAAASQGSGSEPHRIRAHVLVVEDNLINQEVMREHLTAFGCSFKVVDNGEEAVKAFEKTNYDIILMDCQMPIMDGLSATAEIRALEQKHNLKRTPIVAVSAHAFERERVRCLGAQMDDFLSKPYTEDQLADIMEKALNTPRRVRAA